MAAVDVAEDVLEPIHASGRRILVAEDSSITHELLKLLLTHRGHRVDIASDGLLAIEALRTTHYDVALLDFHLPNMNGAQIADAIRNSASTHHLPRLVAITADVEGLLGSPGCESFDHVIPKPLDIYHVGQIIEEQADIGELHPRLGSGTSSHSLRKEGATPTTVFEGFGYQFLSWPDDLQVGRLSAGAMQATLGDPRFDGILIRSVGSDADLGSIWRHKALHVLPIIDLTGTLGPAADFDASDIGSSNIEGFRSVIERFQDQRVRLHRDLLLSEDASEQLIARVFVSGRALTPFYQPRSKCSYSYNTIVAPANIASVAAKLKNDGLLRRTFFDRFHICASCGSSRMNIREECSKCRSADLVEEPYLHHFRCAHQGPDSDFRHGNDLTCPKCRRNLEHFGFDYDRPGSIMFCQNCSHGDSEPDIGFICLDCGAHADSANSDTRDIFAYELSAQGVGFAEYGRSFLGSARNALRFADLPIELVVALNRAAETFNNEKRLFTLVNIFYENEREIVLDHGARQFAQARSLFVENMRAAAKSTDCVVRGQSYDFLLLRNIGPVDAESYVERMLAQSQATVRFDLGAKFQAFGPEDIS